MKPWTLDARLRQGAASFALCCLGAVLMATVIPACGQAPQHEVRPGAPTAEAACTEFITGVLQDDESRMLDVTMPPGNMQSASELRKGVFELHEVVRGDIDVVVLESSPGPDDPESAELTVKVTAEESEGATWIVLVGVVESDGRYYVNSIS